MDPGCDRTPHDERLYDEGGSKHRRNVETFLYHTVETRRDLAVTASELGSRVANPMNAYMTAAKSALRYCKGAKYLSLIYAQVPIFTWKTNKTQIGYGTK